MNRAFRMSITCLCVCLSGFSLAADPRPIEIHVDATDAPRKLFRANLTIPVQTGPLTLYYPKWIQGNHRPSGPILDLSGLKLTANGQPITWHRDDIDQYAFHCTVPTGVSSIDASLEYLIPGAKGGYQAAMTASARLAVINWYWVTLYPKGIPVRDIPIRASLTVPQGWHVGTALPIESQKENLTQFKTVSLETFADAPAIIGEYFREVPVGPKDGPPHFLVLACDSPAGLNISDQLKGHYDRLVTEAHALFGARHYRSYRFLVALSDHVSHGATEHHESSNNRVSERMMVDDIHRKLEAAWLLPHEFVHSWNGKYRRPEGLVAADFQQPLKTNLLWVYEGLTEYLGFVLAARSGLYTPEISRDNLATIADWAKNQTGRNWRPLEDTAVAAPHLYMARDEWGSRRRGVDFYDEAALVWLDADTLIREKTDGKKSLDDFCRLFFGGQDGAPEVKPYTYEDMLKALNHVMPFDWNNFFTQRINAVTPAAPLGGITRGGWKLVHSTERTELTKALEEDNQQIIQVSSIGLLLKSDGVVIDVIAGSAADKAGLGPHMKVVAVNGRRLTAERLREAIAATLNGKTKLTLIAENGDYLNTYTLDYTGGERYPKLERDANQPDRISEIFKPKVARLR